MFYVIGSFLLAGFALQLLERVWPVRSFEHKKEMVVDLLALLLALACQIAIASQAFPILFRVQQLPAVDAARSYVLTLPPLATGFFYFLVIDFIAYWVHRLNHTRWLWATHAFHHSPRNLYWASGARGSPVHYFLLGLPALLVQVIFSPTGAILWVSTAYGVLHNSLIHSNVKLPALLNGVFVTGESHLVHHARDSRLGNSNFGFLFSFWDHLFGTYVDPRSLPQNYPLGLEYEVGYMRLALGLPATQSPASQPARQRRKPPKRVMTNARNRD